MKFTVYLSFFNQDIFPMKTKGCEIHSLSV